MAKAPETGTKDTLRVVLSYPRPQAHDVLAKRFEENAAIGSQGRTKTMLMQHNSSGAEAYAERGFFSRSWQLRVTAPNGDDEVIDARTNLGWIGDQQGLRIAASHLAATLVGPKDMLAEISEHDLTQDDVLVVQVGETNRTLDFRKVSKGVLSEDRMIVEAEIPMPPQFEDLADFHADRADRRNVDQGIVIVGDHVTGKIRAEQQSTGGWKAIGQGDVDYKRSFSRDHDADQVILEIAEDIASREISEEAIVNHVRRNGAPHEDVKAITLNGQKYDMTEFNYD